MELHQLLTVVVTASFSGTSGATPHACGTVALVLSINPNLTPAEVSMIMQTTAVEKGRSGKR